MPRYVRPKVALVKNFDATVIHDDVWFEILSHLNPKTVAAFSRTSKRMNLVADQFVKNLRLFDATSQLVLIRNNWKYKTLVITCKNSDRTMSSLLEFIKAVGARTKLENIEKIEVVGAKFSVELEPLLRILPKADHVILRNTVYPPIVSPLAPMRHLEQLTVFFFRPRQLDVSNLRVSTLSVQRASFTGTGTVSKLIIKHHMRGKKVNLGMNEMASCLTANEVVCQVTNKSKRGITVYPAELVVHNVRANKVDHPWHTEVTLWKVEQDEWRAVMANLGVEVLEEDIIDFDMLA